jgi:hypothetical protein
VLSNLTAFVAAKFFRQNNLRLQFSLIKWFNSYMTGTTTLTTTLPLVLVPLPGGNTAGSVPAPCACCTSCLANVADLPMIISYINLVLGLVYSLIHLVLSFFV